MSSIIGHSLVGFSLSKLSKNKTKIRKWNLWLIFLAIFPDLNYIAFWIFGAHPIFQYSHSIGAVVILPILSILFLKYKKDPNIISNALILFCAAFSHLVLDLLVGVFPKPYLWPFYDGKLKLPFGILPSAGKLDLHNIYLYKNLLIELGILLPIVGMIYLLKNRVKINYFIPGLVALLMIWILFLKWGISLVRT